MYKTNNGCKKGIKGINENKVKGINENKVSLSYQTIYLEKKAQDESWNFLKVFITTFYNFISSQKLINT